MTSEPLFSILTVIVAFFAGSIPFGVLVSRGFFGTDIRRSGSGNIGAANALRTLGKRGAAAVLVLDVLKGFAPTLAAGKLGGTAPATLAAFASVAGHCLSPFLGFRGGKGVATFLGAVTALWWPAGIAFALVWMSAALAFGFASLASMLASAAMAPVLWMGLDGIGLACGIVTALFIIYRHRENIDRLRRGTENRLSLLKASTSND